MTSLKRESVTADNSTLRIAYKFYISSLTTASESRLFGSVVENWIIDPAARVRFPPKSWDFFQPNLLCFIICYDFHVVRWGLVRDEPPSYDMKAATKNKA